MYLKKTRINKSFNFCIQENIRFRFIFAYFANVFGIRTGDNFSKRLKGENYTWRKNPVYSISFLVSYCIVLGFFFHYRRPSETMRTPNGRGICTGRFGQCDPRELR